MNLWLSSVSEFCWPHEVIHTEKILKNLKGQLKKKKFSEMFKLKENLLYEN